MSPSHRNGTLFVHKLDSCSDPVSLTHILMISVVMVCSIVSNGSLCLLLVRFKRLRTVPNVLIVNIAVGDIINAIVNMPLMILWYVCKMSFLRGRPISFTVISFYAFSIYLTLFSLVTLTLDRYGAIVHGLRYHSWKTRNKALVAVAITWLLALIYTYGQFSIGANIDLSDAVVFRYRLKYFRKFGVKFLLTAYYVSFGLIVILAVRMCRTVHTHDKALTKSCHTAKRHTIAEVAATKTVGITLLAFFMMGVLPVMLHSFAKMHGTWPHFLGYFFLHMNSMANPIIYSLRTRRFRRALLLLIRDPCGKTQFMAEVKQVQQCHRARLKTSNSTLPARREEIRT